MAIATSVLRPVYCVTEHHYRSMTRARDACAGRFTNAGVARTVAGEPDWTDINVEADREWWIEWSKFYVGLDLAFAFGRTGEFRFVETWQRLVSSWIAQVPAGFGPTDAAGRRLQNWIYAWQIFAADHEFRGFDEPFECRLLEAIQSEALHLQENLTAERNHRTLELYALLIVGLALPDLDPGGARADFAWSALTRNLHDDFRSDGVQREHSTHYHMIALRSLVGARENARRFGLHVPDTFDDHLTRALEFGIYVQRPDGTLPALSDSDDGDYRELLEMGARLVGREDLVRAVSGGAVPGLPAIRAFRSGGYYVQRSEWGRGTPRHLVLDCGPIGDGGHGHYDALSIEVWAGRPLIVDPGRYTYAEGTPNWRRWFKGTAAHNTVCVDGLDQTEYRSGKPRRAPAVSRLVARASAPGLAVACADVRSSNYDVHHTRLLFFVDSRYWIVADILDSQTVHDYDLRFHLAADAEGRAEVGAHHVLAPGLLIATRAAGTICLEDGWVSPHYGVKLPAPVVSISQRASVAQFVTAIVPEGSRDWRISDEAVCTVPQGRVSIAHGDAFTDTIEWTADVAAESADRPGRVAWTRRSRDGRLLELASVVMTAVHAQGGCA